MLDDYIIIISFSLTVFLCFSFSLTKVFTYPLTKVFHRQKAGRRHGGGGGQGPYGPAPFQEDTKTHLEN